MKRKSCRNYQEEKEQSPDCCTCIHRQGCARYAENSFCGRWQSKEPEPAGTDPNEAWKRGDDVEF